MIDTLNIRVFCNIYQSFKVFRLQRYGISASEVQSPKSKFKCRKYAEIKNNMPKAEDSLTGHVVTCVQISHLVFFLKPS